MRSAPLTLLLLSSAALAEPKLGPWGEDPAKAPSFCFPQERRAPKLYDADARYRESAEPLVADHLENALLVCYVSIGRKPGGWDLFLPPDALIELRLRKDPPIRLWGPEDHHDFYVSIPRVTLARGDEAAVTLWDRDMQSNDLVGSATTKYEGKTPLAWQAKWFTMECRAMTQEVALRHARLHLDTLDKRLAEAGGRKPDPRQRDFGSPSEIAAATAEWGAGNFRYAAAPIGWEHPLIQERLARLAAVQQTWQQKVKAEVARLLVEAPAPGAEAQVGAATARVEVQCGAEARKLAGGKGGKGAKGDACAATLTFSTPVQTATLCQAFPHKPSAAFIDEEGRSFDVAAVLLPGPDGKLRPCTASGTGDAAAPAAPPTTERVVIASGRPRGDPLLWLSLPGAPPTMLRLR